VLLVEPPDRTNELAHVWKTLGAGHRHARVDVTIDLHTYSLLTEAYNVDLVRCVPPTPQPTSATVNLIWQGAKPYLRLRVSQRRHHTTSAAFMVAEGGTYASASSGTARPRAPAPTTRRCSSSMALVKSSRTGLVTGSETVRRLEIGAVSDPPFSTGTSKMDDLFWKEGP